MMGQGNGDGRNYLRNPRKDTEAPGGAPRYAWYTLHIPSLCVPASLREAVSR